LRRLGQRLGDRIAKADGDFFHGQPDEHQFGREQYIELGDEWRDQHHDYPGIVHVHVGQRFDDGLPDHDYDLHAYGVGQRWLHYGHGDGHCWRIEPDGQLVCGQPSDDYSGWQHDFELGHQRRNEHQHQPWRIYLNFGERFHQRFAHRDYRLHVDGQE
jgi:hypothetical protein